MFRHLSIKLDQIKYSRVIWLLAVAETLHNLEEAIWLPEWSQTVGYWHPSVTAFQFRFAAVIITLVFYGVIYYYSIYRSDLSKYLIAGTLVLILLNVFIPHLLATIALGRYAPGVITGVILNVPIPIYLLRRGLAEGEFKFNTLTIGSIILAITIIPLIIVLFITGSLLEGILQ